MKKSLAIALLLTGAGTTALSASASADTMAVPVGQQGTSNVQIPGRGLNMYQVEERFGTPQDRKSPIGDPPIIRWVYSGYTVYFESDYVIHSVRHPGK